MIERRKRIFGLDLMRAVVITLVLISHVWLFFPNYNNIFTDSLQVIGMYGVEIFFVLSGFLIGGILLDIITTSNFYLKEVYHFWIRRWFRTLPLYFLMLFLNVLLFYFLKKETPEEIWKYLLFLQNFKDEYLYFFPESWSLSIEEYTYLVAPLGLLFFSKACLRLNIKKENIFLLNALVLCFLLIVSKLFFYYNNLENNQTFTSWSLNLKPIVIYRLDSIFIGFVLVYIFRKRQDFFKAHKRKFLLVGLVLLSLLMISILVYPIEKGNTFYWNVLFLPLNSFAISLSAPFLYFLEIPFEKLTGFIEKISLYSYSMYLLHYSFTFCLIEYVLDLNEISLIEGFVYTMAYFITIYFLSKLLYLFFEKPITDLRDSRVIRRLFN